MAVEFKIIEKEVGKLAINYEELKRELSKSIKVYDGIQVVESINYDDVTPYYEDGMNGVVVYADNQGNKIVTFADAKQIRAKLNKVSKAINDRKIELKKEFLKPYEIVDSQAKELIKIIADTNNVIDEQVKSAEEKERQEKLSQIIDIWERNNYSSVGVAFTEVLDQKWLNKSVSLANVEKEMDAKVYKFKSDLKAIDDLVPNKNKAILLKSKYLLNPNLSEIIAQYNLEEAKAKELLSKQPVEEELVEEEVEEVSDGIELRIAVKGNKRDIDVLIDFLNASNLNYRIVTK